MGELARLTGQLAVARTRLATAWEQVEQLAAPPQYSALVASALGQLDTAEGDLAAAHDRQRQALDRALTASDAPVIARVLVGIADLAAAQGDPERAAMLLGASVAVRGTEDRSLVDAQRIAGAARDAIGEPRFAEAYRRGTATVPSEQAVRMLAAIDPPA